MPFRRWRRCEDREPSPRPVVRRGVHTSTQALEDDIRAWIRTWNESPKPFTWTKSADEILSSPADCLTKSALPSLRKP